MASQQPTPYITGSPLPRTDGLGKVTGAALYTADVPVPDSLWGRLLRSPHPYARIKSVDVTRARALPGVHAIVTGADVASHMTGRRIFDIPLIANRLQGIIHQVPHDRFQPLEICDHRNAIRAAVETELAVTGDVAVHHLSQQGSQLDDRRGGGFLSPLM